MIFIFIFVLIMILIFILKFESRCWRLVNATCLFIRFLVTSSTDVVCLIFIKWFYNDNIFPDNDKSFICQWRLLWLLGQSRITSIIILTVVFMMNVIFFYQVTNCPDRKYLRCRPSCGSPWEAEWRNSPSKQIFKFISY